SWTIAERLTLNLGFRYDRSTAHWATPGQDAFTFNDYTGRLFGTYDLTGDGKTVIKGGWGRYYDALHGNIYDDFDPSLPSRAFYVFNTGLGGGCGQPVSGFPNVGGGPECFEGTEASNVDVVSINDPNATIGIDPGINNKYVNLAYVGFEREIAADVSVGVTYIRKSDGNLFAGRDDQSVYAPTTVEDPGTGQTISAFERITPSSQEFRVLTNRDDIYFRDYNGFELRLQKRFRNNWQFLGSWTIQKAEGTHDNNAAAPGLNDSLRGANPNDLINADGELLNSRRNVLKLQGSYRIPGADVLLSALYGFQSGRTYNRILRARLPQRVDILLDPRGSYRMPERSELDIHVEKFFRFGANQELGILVDAFNLFNDDAYTFVNETSGDNFGDPTEVIEPRKLQVGIRFSF
ncbi:MAG TPA: hypothetical protein VEK15_32310, partial [Vicinamibacteria bacterium]|nr:hypothetical protein [Vicinamibacteria bacterium]